MTDLNPVLIAGHQGPTMISWNVGDGSIGKISLSKDGRPAIFFRGGRHGRVNSRMRAGSIDELRLYKGTDRTDPIASVVVSTT